MGLFGHRQVRAEDDNLIVGRGRYIDDLRFPNMLHVAIVRSQAARAMISVSSLASRFKSSIARWLADPGLVCPKVYFC